MSSNCKYRYGALEAGSYFGDISLMTGYKNEFGYFYNTGLKEVAANDLPPAVNLLVIDGKKFLEICEEHKLCAEVFIRRAKNKEHNFRMFKYTTLLGYMKTLVKNPDIINKQLLKGFSIFDEGNEKKKHI